MNTKQNAGVKRFLFTLKANISIVCVWILLLLLLLYILNIIMQISLSPPEQHLLYFLFFSVPFHSDSILEFSRKLRVWEVSSIQQRNRKCRGCKESFLLCPSIPTIPSKCWRIKVLCIIPFYLCITMNFSHLSTASVFWLHSKKWF